MFQKIIKLGLVITVLAASISAQDYFKNWEKGTSPQEVGKRLAENWAARTFEFEQINPETKQPKRKFVIYPEICTWYGSLKVAKSIKDSDLQKRLVAKWDRFMTEKGRENINPIAHVDYSMVGTLPLEIFIQTKSKPHLEFGQKMADKQFSDTTPDGITKEARYWIDDMYMITILQTQAYRATKNKKYLDWAALTADAYLTKLQKENGLFHHADDSFFYWSRGNGWFAAGMAELLSDLPKNHPKYNSIMKSFQKMMDTLLKTQSANGLWRQLLDKEESWEETSGTGMFAFAMVQGVKKGWLDKKTFGPAARKAWLAMVNKLDEKANIKDVCIGTNKGFSVQYYLDRERKTGDLHGQAAITWTAMALLAK
jgi:rhamnogalacturonyl hydrolase YesR